MERAQIIDRLNELTRLARERQMCCDGMLAATMGGSELSFMSSEELQERHQLMMALPTAAEEREAVRARIQARIAARREGRRHG